MIGDFLKKEEYNERQGQKNSLTMKIFYGVNSLTPASVSSLTPSPLKKVKNAGGKVNGLTPSRGFYGVNGLTPII
jgi:hypothetical protein